MVLRIIARNDLSYLPSGLIKCIANKLVGCTRRIWNLSLISRCYHRSKEFIVIKIQLDLGDNEFFRAMIASRDQTKIPDPSRASHKLISDAFDKARRQVRKIVSGYDPKDHGDVLNKWLRFVEHGAQVILLKVPSGANAYKMFETLNDRGLKTSQADLVKNYLFGQSGTRLTEAQQKWARMRGSLETLDEEDITVTFLR